MAEARKLEWRTSVDNGTTERLAPKTGLSKRIILGLKDLVMKIFVDRIANFMRKAWRIGADDPAKIVHGLKVGLALSIVSIFYYMKPLYDGVGGNAMWAIMTVVVVFESNVGATIYKCVNRVVATILAGSLGIGVHWVANLSGKAKPFVIGCTVFLFAFTATYSRFVPAFKARFDYGAMIFILTLSFVSIDGYRVDKLVDVAQQRVATIAIGTSICIIITVFLCPIWAGSQLHRLVQHNFVKLADSLDGYVAKYFKEKEALTNQKANEETNMKLQGFTCVLNSKGAEETMANLAIWEPAHGNFKFRHPWKLYVNIGAAMRRCAYCLENLSICIYYEAEATDQVKKHFGNACKKLSLASSKILRELADMMKNMRKSSKLDFLVFEMNSAVQELQATLKTIPIETNKPEEEDDCNDRTKSTRLHEVLPVATLLSLLIEHAARIQTTVKAVGELANRADFKQASKKKIGGNNHH